MNDGWADTDFSEPGNCYGCKCELTVNEEKVTYKSVYECRLVGYTECSSGKVTNARIECLFDSSP